MVNDNIAMFVVGRRRSLGLTQVELAERAGVGLRFIRELESGKSTARRDKIEQVLALFGHTLGPVPIARGEPTEEHDGR